MKDQHFTLTVPEGLHDSILKACEGYEHVDQSNKHELIITPPDGDGLVFSIKPILGKNEATVTILENPNDVHVVHIRQRLLADIEEVQKTGKVERYEMTSHVDDEPEIPLPSAEHRE